MDKLTIIRKLDGLAQEVKNLRNELLNDEQDNIRFPYYYNTPISDLRLPGLRYANCFFNACAKHHVTTIGQLITHGRASVSKWSGVGPRMISVLAEEFRDRYHVKW